MFPPDLLATAASLLDRCRLSKLRLATAESCTGGLASAVLTAIPGSSDVFARGYVTYDNQAKAELLGVSAVTLARLGAVNEEVARAMAAGALARSGVDLVFAITGIAGPGGGSPAKPVGLVHFASARRDGALFHERRVFPGYRDQVRCQSVAFAFDLVSRHL